MTTAGFTRRPLMMLALGLALTGLLSCSQVVLLLSTEQEVPLLAIPTWFRPIMILGAIAGAAMVWGAFLISRLEAYWFARVVCVLAILPLGIGCLPGIPLGFWGLQLLARPEVRRAFVSRASYYRQELEQALDDFDADLREAEDRT